MRFLPTAHRLTIHSLNIHLLTTHLRTIHRLTIHLLTIHLLPALLPKPGAVAMPMARHAHTLVGPPPRPLRRLPLR